MQSNFFLRIAIGIKFVEDLVALCLSVETRIIGPTM